MAPVCLIRLWMSDLSFHKKPQSTISPLNIALRHHSLTHSLSAGILTAPSKNSWMVNSLWMCWALNMSLKGKNEKRKHHISILPFCLTHLFFPLPWICHPSQGRRGTATNEMEATLNEKFLLGISEQEGCWCIYSCTWSLFHSHCISVLRRL